MNPHNDNFKKNILEASNEELLGWSHHLKSQIDFYKKALNIAKQFKNGNTIRTAKESIKRNTLLHSNVIGLLNTRAEKIEFPV